MQIDKTIFNGIRDSEQVISELTKFIQKDILIKEKEEESFYINMFARYLFLDTSIQTICEEFIPKLKSKVQLWSIKNLCEYFHEQDEVLKKLIVFSFKTNIVKAQLAVYKVLEKFHWDSIDRFDKLVKQTSISEEEIFRFYIDRFNYYLSVNKKKSIEENLFFKNMERNFEKIKKNEASYSFFKGTIPLEIQTIFEKKELNIEEDNYINIDGIYIDKELYEKFKSLDEEFLSEKNILLKTIKNDLIIRQEGLTKEEINRNLSYYFNLFAGYFIGDVSIDTICEEFIPKLKKQYSYYRIGSFYTYFQKIGDNKLLKSLLLYTFKTNFIKEKCLLFSYFEPELFDELITQMKMDKDKVYPLIIDNLNSTLKHEEISLCIKRVLKIYPKLLEDETLSKECIETFYHKTRYCYPYEIISRLMNEFLFRDDESIDLEDKEFLKRIIETDLEYFSDIRVKKTYIYLLYKEMSHNGYKDTLEKNILKKYPHIEDQLHSYIIKDLLSLYIEFSYTMFEEKIKKIYDEYGAGFIFDHYTFSDDLNDEDKLLIFFLSKYSDDEKVLQYKNMIESEDKDFFKEHSHKEENIKFDKNSQESIKKALHEYKKLIKDNKVFCEGEYVVKFIEIDGSTKEENITYEYQFFDYALEYDELEEDILQTLKEVINYTRDDKELLNLNMPDDRLFGLESLYHFVYKYKDYFYLLGAYFSGCADIEHDDLDTAVELFEDIQDNEIGEKTLKFLCYCDSENVNCYLFRSWINEETWLPFREYFNENKDKYEWFKETLKQRFKEYEYVGFSKSPIEDLYRLMMPFHETEDEDEDGEEYYYDKTFVYDTAKNEAIELEKEIVELVGRNKLQGSKKWI